MLNTIFVILGLLNGLCGVVLKETSYGCFGIIVVLSAFYFEWIRPSRKKGAQMLSAEARKV